MIKKILIKDWKAAQNLDLETFDEIKIVQEGYEITITRNNETEDIYEETKEYIQPEKPEPE